MNQLNTVPSGKKPLSKTRKIIYASIIAVFVIIIIVSNRGGSTLSSAPVASTPTALVGDVAYLQSTSPILVAPTEESFDRAIQLAVAKDNKGLMQMALAGDIFTVPIGTQVRVISKNFPKTEVRIENGDSAGKSGWVPYEFVSSTPPEKKVSVADNTKIAPTPDTKKNLVSEQKTPTEEVATAIVKRVITSPYCSTENECAGFKAKIDFHEDKSCVDHGVCDYYDNFSPTKQVYYLTVRGDVVSGSVVNKNLNSGAEEPYETLYGTYNSSTGDIKFTYSYYRYPNIMEGFYSFTNKGKISGNQFSGSNDIHLNIKGDVSYLPTTIKDEIPKKTCLIKGDKSSASGSTPIYYIQTSASYSKITSNYLQYFCSEAEAAAAGYTKALQ